MQSRLLLSCCCWLAITLAPTSPAYAQEDLPRRRAFGGPFGHGDQGEILWQDRRTFLLKQFDADKDGRLDAKERDALRKHRFADLYPTRPLLRPKRNLPRAGWPLEFIERYDTNKDGILDDAEADAARASMLARAAELTRLYDRNLNRRLDDPELDAIREDARSGRLEDVPVFLLYRQGRREWGRRSEPNPVQRWLDAADADGDGRASAAELEQARAQIQRAKKAEEDPSR